MNVYKFTSPTGQIVEVTGPAGSTYEQALAVFNQQSLTGSLAGLKAGDVLNSLIQAKGGLSTALAQVTSGITASTISQIGAAIKIPNLPVQNPVNISTFVKTSVLESGTVGSLSTTQIQGLMSSTAAATKQNPTELTNEKGLGTYGLTPDQLQQAGLIKPGIAELIKQDPSSLTSVLSSPAVWTGVGGATDLDAVLANPTLQSVVQQSSLTSSYQQLSDLGVVSSITGVIGSQTDLGAVVNNAANYGLTATTDWLKNTVGGSEIGKLTTSAIESVFGMSFGSANQSASGGGNPLQTGVQSPKGYSNTVNRQVIDSSFNSIIGNSKIPSNIFSTPALGIDVRTQATQLNTINQSSSILLTQLASTSAGVAALLQIPGASNIMSLLKSGQGLTDSIPGAAQLLDKAKNLPGVSTLLQDIPGSKEILSSFETYGSELLSNTSLLKDLDISAITDFDVSSLLGGADAVIADAGPVVEEAFEAIASFW